MGEHKVDDKLKLTRIKGLPPQVRQTVERLTGGFDSAAVESIRQRMGGAFAKLERKDTLHDPEPTNQPSEAALKEGALLSEATNATSLKKRINKASGR